MRDGVISAERVQETIDFVGETRPHRGPAHRAGRSSISWPRASSDCPVRCWTPSGPHQSCAGPAGADADAAANNAVQLQLPALMAQLDGAADQIGAIDVTVESSYQAVIERLTAAQTSLWPFRAAFKCHRELEQRLSQVDLASSRQTSGCRQGFQPSRSPAWTRWGPVFWLRWSGSTRLWSPSIHRSSSNG